MEVKSFQVTLGQINTAQEAFGRLVAPSVRLPIKSAYHIAKLVRLLEVELKHFEEQRTKFIKELGEQIKVEGDVWKVKNDNLEEFQKRMNELAGISVDINWGPINFEMLGSIEISVGDLVILEPFIKES